MPAGSRRARRPLAVLAAVSATPAAAHAPVPGIDGFYTGLAHVAVEPALSVATLAVLLLMVQDWPDRFRRSWPVFALAVLAGLFAGRALDAAMPLDIALLAAALAAAAAAALVAERLGAAAAAAIAACCGLLVGAGVLPEPGPARDVIVTAAGGAAGAALAPLVLAGGIDLLTTRAGGPVLRTGLRVAASWVFAVALMLLAFLLRPGT